VSLGPSDTTRSTPMQDPVALYRTAQAVTSNPVDRVVLLYEGAIRFAVRHVDALERGDTEAAHQASLRSQAIVAELMEVLDLSAGPVARQLDSVYRFILERLAAGNIARDPQPTTEVLDLLRELLTAWQEVSRMARGGRPAPMGRPAPDGALGLGSAPLGLAGARTAVS